MAKGKATPDDVRQAMKATYLQTGGNLTETAKAHGVPKSTACRIVHNTVTPAELEEVNAERRREAVELTWTILKGSIVALGRALEKATQEPDQSRIKDLACCFGIVTDKLLALSGQNQPGFRGAIVSQHDFQTNVKKLLAVFETGGNAPEGGDHE